jgi:hypothetical protein
MDVVVLFSCFLILMTLHGEYVSGQSHQNQKGLEWIRWHIFNRMTLFGKKRIYKLE